MDEPNPESDLGEIGDHQARVLEAATKDVERASAVIQAIIDAHDEGLRREEPQALRIEPMVPRGRALAEGFLAVADELLVWERDADAALAAIKADQDFQNLGAQVDRIGLATPRVERLRLSPQVPRGDGAERFAIAVAALDRAGLRVSFDHAVLHNDVGTIFSPIRPFMTAKGAAPPTPLAGFRLPPRPPARHGGNRIKVAIIDTGAEFERADPADGRTDGWLSDVRGEDDPTTEGLKPDTVLAPGAGHGSAVASVVQFLAPGAEVVSYAPLYKGLGSEVAVAQAILRAADEGADVINLSLGTPAVPEHAPLALEDALSLLDEEILVVAAAGNSGSFALQYPAAFKRVVAVGATTADWAPAAYSSRGYWVDVSTRGTGVAAPFTQGTVQLVDDQGNPTAPASFDGRDPIAALTGTSFAAPQVAGRLAHLRDAGLGATDALRALTASGTPEPDFGSIVRLLEQ
jgi:hypothetical protein